VTNGFEPISVAERKLRADPWQWLALTAIALAAVAADQLTKHIVAGEITLDDGVHVLGPLWIRHVQNSGIAFGLFAQSTAVVIVLTTIAIAWMLVYFGRSGAKHPVLPVALGLVIGGSASNLVDRVRLGYVTDFIDLRWWPTFNFADSFIVLGVALLLWILFRAEPPRPEPAIDLTNR
jgi:signal peptidase II